eukprot:156875-Hanusia_phi.AAC.1
MTRTVSATTEEQKETAILNRQSLAAVVPSLSLIGGFESVCNTTVSHEFGMRGRRRGRALGSIIGFKPQAWASEFMKL